MPTQTVTAKHIEDCLIALLKDGGTLDDLEIVAASDRSATVPPLHAFVYCVNANPVVPAGPLYRPNVVLTLVTSIHDHTQELREEWTKKLHDRLVEIGLEFQGDGGEWADENLGICGLAIKGTRELSQDDQTGDAIDLVLGVELTGLDLWKFTAEEPAVSERVIPESVAPVQVQDRIYQRTTAAITITDWSWDWAWKFPDLREDESLDSITRWSSNTAVIVPDPDDETRWNAIAPGTAIIRLSTPAGSIERTVVVVFTGGGTSDVFTGYAPDCLRVLIPLAIDSRLAGKSAATALRIFSTQDHAGSNYVRNLNCWAADLDLTPMSPWNSAGGATEAGTLVSPRHIVFATHFQPNVGSTIRLVTANNQVVNRTMTAKMSLPGYVSYYPDVTVGLLNSDVPGSIGFARVLPDNWAAWLPNNGILGLPALTLDQEEKALVTDLTSITSAAGMYGAMASFQVPTDAQRLAFYEAKIGGDSGNPACIIIDGKLVILCVWTFGGAGSGTSITYWKAGINALMTALGGGYQLTEIDLSGHPSY